jgi:hypothetical protein
VKQLLQELNYDQKDYNEDTYYRRGSGGSSLDHIFMNFQAETQITTRRMKSSDHDYLEAEITMSDSPYET